LGNLLKICPFVRLEEEKEQEQEEQQEEEIIKRTFGFEFGTQICIPILYLTG